MPQNIGGALGLHRIACSDIGLRADLTARWNSGTRGVRNLEAEVIRPLSRENLRGGEYDSCRFVADLHLSADLFDRRKQRLGLDSLLGTSPGVAALDDGAALIGKFKQFLNLSQEILCKNRLVLEQDRSGEDRGGYEGCRFDAIQRSRAKLRGG
jgi:hypothetical protein